MMKLFFTTWLLLLLSSPALGFNVRTTQTGQLVKWDSDYITVVVDDSIGMLGDETLTRSLIEEAFENWVLDAELNITFDFVSGDCTAAFDQFHINENCVEVVDGVRVGTDGDVGANTKVTYDPETGEIKDADIVIFKEAGQWRLEDGDEGEGEGEGIDFFKVILHEVGHFLGLTHSTVTEAAMYPTLNIHVRGIVALDNDDIYGAEALYDDREMTEQTSCQVLGVATAQSTGLLRLLVSLFQ